MIAADADAATVSRQRELGARLRSIRLQQDLSLAQVEDRSEGRWKAVVVGAYERGDRAVTIARLADLAGFYRVPLSHLLITTQPAPPVDDDPVAVVDPPGGVMLDLAAVRGLDARSDALGAVARFADRICRLRGDHGGRVVTLRDADLRTLALSSGLLPEELYGQLAADGLLFERD